jgi:indolepyruvate ferredoxin oxidoreductase, beta subunit
MSGTANIALVGLRGQPVVATALLLARAAMAAGLDVALSEAPGLALPRASVAVHVRMGEEVRSPIIWAGTAGVLLAFEQLEALRAAPLLAASAFVALAGEVVPTWRMRAGLDPRPTDAAARLGALGARVVGVRAERLLRPSDGPPLQGLVLLGLASALLPVPRGAFEAALAEDGPVALDARRAAFSRGRAIFERLPPHLASGTTGH